MKLLQVLAVVFFLTSCQSSSKKWSTEKVSQSKLEWVLNREQVPRGGTTTGKKIDLSFKQDQVWKDLQNEPLGKKEKDRLAILSMAGSYKANFEFLETYGSQFNYKLDRPYKSWGTEIVIPIEESENFISLQHILVMWFKNKKGTLEGPLVMKHWRQDWRFGDKETFSFSGDKTWRKIHHKGDSSGLWSQAVYQVDDSLRYKSRGKWEHLKGGSHWMSEKTTRPLPRREYSVRKDYNILEGYNQVTVLSWGWVHEELNRKINRGKKPELIGAEIGTNRYLKVPKTDFESGIKYWDETKVYWNEVRKTWAQIHREEEKFCLHGKVDGKPLFMFHFEQAEKYRTSDKRTQESLKKEAKGIIRKFLKKLCA